MAKVADAPQLYKQSMEEFLKVAKYPLIKLCDMTSEMREEAVDVCITAVEKFPAEREKCTQTATINIALDTMVARYNLSERADQLCLTEVQLIKDTMDKKFGPAWQVVVGQGFSYDVQYEVKNLLYLFVGGTTGVLLWKV